MEKIEQFENILIKVDVEGHEKNVLQSIFEDTIHSNNIKNITILVEIRKNRLDAINQLIENYKEKIEII